MINALNFNKNSITSNFSLVSLTIFSIFLFSAPITINEVFATHLSNDIKWQLVFISSQGCSLHNYEMMNQYDEVAEKYLEMYTLENSPYEPECIPESEYLDEFQSPHDLDLIILVYDRELGEKVLHAQKMGGLFSHSGSDRNYNHVIMLCDCSNFYYSNSFWILSHELSHFVLFYHDFEMSVIEDTIHSNDARYDACIENGLSCDAYTTKIELESTRTVSVMPIYIPNSNQFTKSDSEGDKVRNSVIGLSKMITKWWASGKISDGDYSNAIGYLVDSDIIPSDDTRVLMADVPIDDQVTWEEKFSEINSNLRNSSPTLENIQNEILEINPTTNQVESKIFVEQVILGLPEWFKTTAGWWAQDKITNDEFKKNIQFLVKSGIIRPHSDDILEGVINEEESLLDLSLQKIIDDIKSINRSDLNNSDIEKLVNQVNLAMKKFDFNNSQGGCQQLEIFIDNVGDLVDNEKLVLKEGQPLINSADIVKLNYC